MDRGSTFFLRTAVVLIGLFVLVLCGLTLRELINGVAGGYAPILIGMYVSVLPFYIALYQTLQLLKYIDQNKAFSGLSVKALNVVKYCALTISGLYAAGMPYIFIVAENDDAPGVILIGLIIVGASLVIATSAGVLRRLLQNAIDLKSENDLMV